MVEVKRKPNNFLGVKDLWINIKELPKYFKILLLVAIVLILFFNFFNVQGASQGWTTNGTFHKGWFVPLARYHGVLHNSESTSLFGTSKSGALTVAILYSLNGLASFSGVLALAMIISGKTSQYFWGLVNAIFYGLFALSVGYVADVLMNIILICGAPLGWYLFEVKGLAYKKEKKYSWKFNLWFYIYTVLVATICVLVLYEFVPAAAKDVFGNNKFYDSTAARVMDSLANGMQIVGYAMQLTNMPQQFIVWLFVDVVKVLKFTNIAPNTLSVNMLIEFGVWLTIASYGAVKRIVMPLLASRKIAKVA